MPIGSILISPNINSYYFSDADNNRLNVLGQADFQYQILPFQQRVLYLAKSLMTDPATVEFHNFNSSGGITHFPSLHLCDIGQNVIGGADAILNVAPAYKGHQVIDGNVWTDPFAGGDYPLISSLWNFLWSDLAAFITPDTPLSVYYLMVSVADKIYYSEPIYLRNSKLNDWDWEIGHPNTLQFRIQNKSNKSQNTNVVVSGWFNDWPTNTIPYFPEFVIRAEGYVRQMDMKVVNIGYLAQSYQQLLISGQQIPQQVLKLGELSTGVPYYMLQMITEALLSDQCLINNYWYKIWNPSSQTTPADLWKVKTDDCSPLIFANCPLTLGSYAQQAMVDPVPAPSTRFHDSAFDSFFD